LWRAELKTYFIRGPENDDFADGALCRKNISAAGCSAQVCCSAARRDAGWLADGKQSEADKLVAGSACCSALRARWLSFAAVLIDILIVDQVPFLIFYPADRAASLIAGFRAGLIVVIASSPLAILAFGVQYPIATTIVARSLFCGRSWLWPCARIARAAAGGA
jgi:hypothetical protein